MGYPRWAAAPVRLVPDSSVRSIARTVLHRLQPQALVGQLSGRVRKRAQAILDAELESRAARERALKRQRMYELMPRRKSGRLQVLDMKVGGKTLIPLVLWRVEPGVRRTLMRVVLAAQAREEAKEQARVEAALRAAELAECVVSQAGC